MERTYRGPYDRRDYQRGDYDRGRYRSGYDDRDYGGRPYSDRRDRDFFDRASDEVRSWFGDDEAERRRDRDEHYDRGHEDRRAYGGHRRDYDRDYRHQAYGREYDRDYGHRDYDYDRRDYDRGFGREEYDDRSDRGGAADWRRTDQDYLASYDRDRSQRAWNRDPRTGYDGGRRYRDNYERGGTYGRSGYDDRRGGRPTSRFGTRDFGDSYSERWEDRARRRDY